jgi:hypothetical protein
MNNKRKMKKKKLERNRFANHSLKPQEIETQGHMTHPKSIAFQ